jgi:hypothetical protein
LIRLRLYYLFWLIHCMQNFTPPAETEGCGSCGSVATTLNIRFSSLPLPSSIYSIYIYYLYPLPSFLLFPRPFSFYLSFICQSPVSSSNTGAYLSLLILIYYLSPLPSFLLFPRPFSFYLPCIFHLLIAITVSRFLFLSPSIPSSN